MVVLGDDLETGSEALKMTVNTLDRRAVFVAWRRPISSPIFVTFLKFCDVFEKCHVKSMLIMYSNFGLKHMLCDKKVSQCDIFISKTSQPKTLVPQGFSGFFWRFVTFLQKFIKLTNRIKNYIY